MRRGTLWFLLSVIFFLSVFAASTFLFWGVRVLPTIAHEQCGCTRGFLFSHPFLVGPFLFLSLLIIFSFFRAIFSPVKTLGKTKRRSAQARLKSFASLAPDVFLFRYQKPEAFTIGFFRPVTYISTAAWQALVTPEERTALLEHEASHRSHYDPFFRFLLIIVSAAIGWVPGVARALDAEELYLEV